jgi:hypothetical protein
LEFDETDSIASFGHCEGLDVPIIETNMMESHWILMLKNIVQAGISCTGSL